MAGGNIELVDLEHALTERSPQFAELVIQYSLQPDPPPGTTADGAPTEVPPDAWTLDRLRSTLHPTLLDGKDDEEKKAVRRAAWQALHESPFAPERLKLADLLIALYEGEPDAWTRNALITIIVGVRIRWGVWRGLKAIYKEAERRHDNEIFGALAYRMDATLHWQANIDRQEVGGATTSYVRRRAWRHMRLVAQSAPELFPEMAVQVLRHYPKDHWMNASWVATHIFAHQQMIGYNSAWLSALPKKLEERAFDESWKLTPEPLLFLLEVAEHEWVCEFAIRGLKQDFEESLRSVDTDWLRRIGSKELAPTQKLVVELLQANPELHQSKLRDLGLHDMALGFLRSTDESVATYAVEYVKAHAPELPVDFLIELAESNLLGPVHSLLMARLEALSPEALGLDRLLRMLDISAVSGLGRKKLLEGFGPSAIDEDAYVRAYLAGHGEVLAKLFGDAKKEVPTAYLVRLADHPDLSYYALRPVLAELGKRPGPEIGMDWFRKAVFEPRSAQVAQQWLTQGKLAGEALDVDWVRDLTRRPTMRRFAVAILGNREIVGPSAIGAPWLLRLLTRADPQLHEFARRYLLTSFAPADFEGGVGGVWALTSARDERRKKRAESVRQFAFDWLRMHHPDIGKTLPEARSLGVEPKATAADYAFERVEPLFADLSVAARQFAADIARAQMLRWDDPDVPYTLAGARHPETRRVGVDALLSIGDADAAMPLPADWLSGERVFGMAASPTKSTRELALTLIRQHYERIGGADELGRLMDSPDREVRLFAVRLLWEKHRPGKGDAFESAEALRRFVRTVLFGLPPGRMERREGGAVDRPLANGVAKRWVVELVRDMGVEEEEFARIISPVLGELAGSEAKGEWQACVAALATLRAAHPGLEVALPSGSVEERPPLERSLR